MFKLPWFLACYFGLKTYLSDYILIYSACCQNMHKQNKITKLYYPTLCICDNLLGRMISFVFFSVKKTIFVQPHSDSSHFACNTIFVLDINIDIFLRAVNSSSRANQKVWNEECNQVLLTTYRNGHCTHLNRHT